MSGICARGSLNCSAAAHAMKWTPIGIVAACVCTRACCNSQRVVSAPTTSAVTPAHEGAAGQIACAFGRHHSSDLQSEPDGHRVRNQGRTTLWNRQRFCKVAQILSQELSSFPEPEFMDLWYTLFRRAAINYAARLKKVYHESRTSGPRNEHSS